MYQQFKTLVKSLLSSSYYIVIITTKGKDANNQVLRTYEGGMRGEGVIIW